VHLALIPLLALPAYQLALSSSSLSDTEEKPLKPSITRPSKGYVGPVRFGSETDRLGRERVGITAVGELKKNEAHRVELVDKCEDLYQSFVKKSTKGAQA
jgi:hypothetical protein